MDDSLKKTNAGNKRLLSSKEKRVLFPIPDILVRFMNPNGFLF